MTRGITHPKPREINCGCWPLLPIDHEERDERAAARDVSRAHRKLADYKTVRKSNGRMRCD